MNQPYTISNLENQDRELGSQNAPFFYKITSGQRHSQSLIFHAQIGTEYYMYRIFGHVSSHCQPVDKFQVQNQRWFGSGQTTYSEIKRQSWKITNFRFKIYILFESFRKIIFKGIFSPPNNIFLSNIPILGKIINLL